MNHSDQSGGRNRVEQRSFEEVSGTWRSCLLSGVEGIESRQAQQAGSGRETEKKEERMSPFAEVVLLASDGSGE